MRPRLMDVCELAGVSAATASRALTGAGWVAPETRERVRAAADQLGYKANRASRTLREGRTRLIGYFMSPPDDDWAPAMELFVAGMVEAATTHELEVVLFAAKPGQSVIDAYHDVLRRGGVDGFVVSNVWYGDPRHAFLRAQGVPFVSFGELGRGEESPWIDVDAFAGMSLVVEHLHLAGRRRIGFVGFELGTKSGDERWDGFSDGCHRCGIEIDDDLVAVGIKTTQSATDAARRIIERGADAIVAASDLLAVGVMNAAAHAGAVVGRDLAVTGYDDIPLARHLRPALTTLRQPLHDLGRQSVDLLVGVIERGASGHTKRVMPELIVRDSCGTRSSGTSAREAPLE
jgi:DNA-binding LacI/PurR family transcriptional regulator